MKRKIRPVAFSKEIDNLYDLYIHFKLKLRHLLRLIKYIRYK